MHKRGLLTTLLLLLALVFSWNFVAAQGEWAIDYAFFACEDKFVIEFSGIMPSGYDIYWQGFGDAAASTPLTAVRRVEVNGDFAVSDQAAYNNGTTFTPGQLASVSIKVARENNPDDTLFTDTSTDIFDGCVEPSSPQAGTAALTGQAGEPTEFVHSGIFTPDGGFLNDRPVFQPEPVVQIGARPSETAIEAELPGRSRDAGLIFAECNDYPLADPGLLFDTDPLQVFWSWFAATPELVQEHIAHAQYQVTLNGWFLPNVQVSEIQFRDGDYWVFYTADLGNAWKPGDYNIGFKLEWDEPISDGYDEFGPGTENERIESGCDFTIERNPWNIEIIHTQPTIPLQIPPP